MTFVCNAINDHMSLSPTETAIEGISETCCSFPYNVVISWFFSPSCIYFAQQEILYQHQIMSRQCGAQNITLNSILIE